MAADRRRARQEALVRVLDAEALDGLVVTSHANIRYLTGFSGSAAVVAVTRADVLLVTDFRYDEQAGAEAGEVARVEVDSTSVWDRFFQELATLGPLGTLGYEAHALSVHDAERFAQAGKAWRWVPTTELVERLRAAKAAGGGAGNRAATGVVRIGPRSATARACRCACRHDGAGCRRAGARSDRGAGVRRGVRPFARSRARARGARSAATLEDQPRSPAGRR